MMDFKKRNKINIKNKEYLFLKNPIVGREGRENISSFDLYNRLASSYAILQDSNFNGRVEVRNCLVLILAKEILRELSSQELPADERCGLPERFYSQVVEKLKGNKKLPQDRDILLINLKQTAEILRNAKLIVDLNGYVKPNGEDISLPKLLHKMIDSFWNDTAWSDLFPSSPEIAEKIYQFKKIIPELLRANLLETETESIARDFLEITNISSKHERFFISFFEFYVINWFSNFGIITLKKEDSGNTLQIDDHGIKLLSAFI